MKTRRAKPICEFRLKLTDYADSYFIRRALKLEHALKEKPKIIRLEMIGEGEIPATPRCLCVRSCLAVRRTRNL